MFMLKKFEPLLSGRLQATERWAGSDPGSEKGVLPRAEGKRNDQD